jgi:hypothetical protein
MRRSFFSEKGRIDSAPAMLTYLQRSGCLHFRLSFGSVQALSPNLAYMKPHYYSLMEIFLVPIPTLTSGKNALETHHSVSFNIELCKQPPLCREPAPIPRTSRYLSSHNAAKWRSKRCSTYWSTTFPLQRSSRGPRWS